VFEYIIAVEPDWIVEFAKKQELVEKANKLKVMNRISANKHLFFTNNVVEVEF